jgi:uracil-DNA glycosylase
LLSELNLLTDIRVIIALGGIAFANVIEIYRQINHAIPSFPFFHGATYPLGNKLPILIASYHPSRQNTQTGRLTTEMFDNIWTSTKTYIN